MRVCVFSHFFNLFFFRFDFWFLMLLLGLGGEEREGGWLFLDFLFFLFFVFVFGLDLGFALRKVFLVFSSRSFSCSFAVFTFGSSL